MRGRNNGKLSPAEFLPKKRPDRFVGLTVENHKTIFEYRLGITQLLSSCDTIIYGLPCIL